MTRLLFLLDSLYVIAPLSKLLDFFLSPVSFYSCIFFIYSFFLLTYLTDSAWLRSLMSAYVCPFSNFLLFPLLSLFLFFNKHAPLTSLSYKYTFSSNNITSILLHLSYISSRCYCSFHHPFSALYPSWFQPLPSFSAAFYDTNWTILYCPIYSYFNFTCILPFQTTYSLFNISFFFILLNCIPTVACFLESTHFPLTIFIPVLSLLSFTALHPIPHTHHTHTSELFFSFFPSWQFLLLISCYFHLFLWFPSLQ